MPFFGPLSPCKKKKKVYTHRYSKLEKMRKYDISTPAAAYGKRRSMHLAKEIYACGKRDLRMWQKRPTHVAKETYTHAKRDLYPCQKRPIPMPNQIDTYANRDLCIRQKRPIHMAKETYT